MLPYDLWYNVNLGAAYTAEQLQLLFGVDPAVVSDEVLNYLGIYYVNQTENTQIDPYLYEIQAIYTISGTSVDQTWIGVPRDLDEAKENGIQGVSETAEDLERQLLEQFHVGEGVATAVASQLTINRPADLQVIIAEMQVISDKLGSQISEVNAAATVDEINNIVNPPTGTLFTGRGAGIGPEDLNESYYTAFNSVSLTEADTELYIPGTATVIPYGIPNPGEFDSLGDCFAVGDYLMQIRETSTARVIAEFECPLNPAGEDMGF